jgi:hypothetical protein
MNEVEMLKQEYSTIFLKKEGRPDWSVKKMNDKEIVHPSIPFVGNKYYETQILLYASAENLTGYDGKLDNDKMAINRHRFFFDQSDDSKFFFPNVHIAPITNGGLVNIVGYVAMKTALSFKFNSPRELLEGVAFANFGKFSIESGKNIDYASDLKKLSKSLYYIEADLTILKPKMIIIPRKIFNHKTIKQLIKKLLPETKVVPIYQIHHFNINGASRLKKYEKKDKNELGILAEWQEHFRNGLTGRTNENFYSFYTYLDRKLV